MCLALFVTHTVHLLSFGRWLIPILWGNNSNLVKLSLLFVPHNAVLSLMIPNCITAVCQPRSDHKQQYKQPDADPSRHDFHQCNATAQLIFRTLARQALQPCSLSVCVCCCAALVQAKQMMCPVQPFWQSMALTSC